MEMPFKNRTSCTNETRRSTTTFATVSNFANSRGMASSYVEIYLAEIDPIGYFGMGRLPYEKCDDLDL